MRTAMLGLTVVALLAIWAAGPARAQSDAQLPTAAPAWTTHTALFDGNLTAGAFLPSGHNLSGGPAVITVGTNDASFHRLTRYRIAAASDYATRAPDAWTIAGMDASGTWDVLDTVADDPGVWTATGQAREFTLAEPTAKSYYRFRMTITDNKSTTDSYLQFAELQFYGIQDTGAGFPLIPMTGASYTCNRSVNSSLSTVFDNNISTNASWIASGYPNQLTFTVTLPASYALKAIAWGDLAPPPHVQFAVNPRVLGACVARERGHRVHAGVPKYWRRCSLVVYNEIFGGSERAPRGDVS